MKNKVTVVWQNGCRKRTSASAFGAGGETLPAGAVVYTENAVIADVDEPNNPDKKWIQLSDGWFIATRYPSNEGAERAKVEPVNNTEPPPSDSDTVTVSVETSDGKRGTATITLK